jgi:glycosyltransferase involved in cell wall biosynthesis
LSKRILIIGGKAWSILNFRASLIKKLIHEKYEVFAIASEATNTELEQIKNLGVKYIDIELKSNTVSIVKDIFYFINLKKKIYNINPHIIMSYTMKPTVYAGLSLFFSKKVIFYPLITGLGNIYNSNKLKLYPVKLILIILCKLALRNAKTIIFQNYDNLKYFNKIKIAPNVKKIIIEGSGVDIKYFTPEIFPNNNFTFLLIARLLKDKGIVEYVEAARKVKSKYKNVDFFLVGPVDHSLNRIKYEYIKKNHDDKIINYLGFQKNVKNYIGQSHVFVLPSYHEGLPRSVLEAMAMGRPIITTDVAGCKETVINNENGFLIPCKSIDLLAEKMIWFINNSDSIFEMGQKSRLIVEKKFSSEKINDKFVKLLSN